MSDDERIKEQLVAIRSAKALPRVVEADEAPREGLVARMFSSYDTPSSERERLSKFGKRDAYGAPVCPICYAKRTRAQAEFRWMPAFLRPRLSEVPANMWLCGRRHCVRCGLPTGFGHVWTSFVCPSCEPLVASALSLSEPNEHGMLSIVEE